MTTEVTGSLSSVHRRFSSLLNLVDPGLYFLQNHIWSDSNSENDFTALLATGKLILELARQDLSVIQRFSHYGSEVCVQLPADATGSHFFPKKSTTEYMSVRVWNTLALVALMEPSASWPEMIFDQLHSCSYAHRTTLRIHVHPGTISLEMTMADINHAYITIKLWMMLAQKVSVNSQASDLASFAVWNELWPPFEGLVDALETEGRAGLSAVSAKTTTYIANN